jgi:hypothetical protein
VRRDRHARTINQEMTMNTKPRIRFTAVLCLAYGTATLASLHTAAARAAQDSVPTRVVHFDGLDIEAGRRAKALPPDRGCCASGV